MDEDEPIDATQIKRGMRGHNSSDDRLRLLIERIENLNEERANIGGDIRDVFSEAKAVGYDPKIMRIILQYRKMRPDDRRERDALVETYKDALGLD